MNNRSLECCDLSEPKVMDVILISPPIFFPNAGNSSEEFAGSGYV